MFPHVCVANGIMNKCFGEIYFGNEIYSECSSSSGDGGSGVSDGGGRQIIIEYEMLISIHDLF